MKIVITDGYAVNPGDLSWEWLEQFGDVAVYDKLSDAAAPSRIGNADVVFTNRVKIGEAVLKACPNLKYVSALGTGYDMIDVAACRERGIEVCNVPGYSTDSVAQVAFSRLVSLARISGASRSTRSMSSKSSSRPLDSARGFAIFRRMSARGSDRV